MKKATLFVVFGIAMAACGVGADTDLTATVIRDIGVTSGVPPLGEGVAPVTGRPGDGAAVVTSVGGWSGGPGAVRWHGGQWLMPYSANPGTTLQNVSCDVLPNSTSTDLVELVSSNGQVLGSNTVPAMSTNVVIRLWIILAAGHAIDPGEQLVLRHSPRDTATGAWTSASQDLTVISCAANAPRLTTLIVPINAPTNYRSVNLSAVGIGNVIGGNVTDPNNGFVDYIPLALPVGTAISTWRVRVQDSLFGGGSSQIASRLMFTTNNNHVPTQLVQPSSVTQSSSSSGTGAEETISATGVNVTTAPSTQYWISVFDLVGTANGYVRRLEVDIIN